MTASRLTIKPLIRILLVEDNPGDVLIVKEHLRYSEINFELIHSPNLQDAILQASRNGFDVILLDLGLPDSLGMETLKQMNASALKAPVIIMTGLDDEETALSSLKEGAQDYLFKNSLSSQNIVHSIRYSIERKKIQELQKKNARQFSTLASATASINEADEVNSIYKICCESIKNLLNESNVFAIESIDQAIPDASYYDWLESYDLTDYYLLQYQMLQSIHNSIIENSTGKIIELKGGLKDLIGSHSETEILESLELILDINRIYILGFSRNEKQYGGIFIFPSRNIETDEINLIEVIGNQASLSIHRRTVEKELILSEQRFRVLNSDLEQRVIERTTDIANINSLLEDELGVRIRLEQELINSKNELEIRVQERTAELAKSEERFHNMFYNHEAVMWLVNPENGIIIEANKSAKQFYGRSFSADEKLKVQDFNISSGSEIEEKMLKAIHQKQNYYVFPHRLASGQVRTVEVYSSPIEMSGERLLFSIIHDVTERQQMEAALKESEALYKAVVNNSLNIILISIGSIIEFTNEAASDFIGMSQGQIIGKNIDELFNYTLIGMEGNSLAGMIIDSVKENRAVEIQVHDRNEDGYSYFLVRSNTIIYRGKEAIMSIFTDITENKDIEKHVMRKVIETEENDRRQFAADLHDDLGPILSAIKLRLGLMEKMRPGEGLRENISISNELAGLVVDKIRTISQNMTPNIIESLGLDAGVRDLCKRIKELKKIDIVFESEIESKRFPPTVELHYYRIISELINNSLKHSEASLININLLFKEEKLDLVYFDNGIGYNTTESLQKTGGIGLHNILNRVNLINGSINFRIRDGITVVNITNKLNLI